MLPTRDVRLLPTLKLEVEKILAAAEFDPADFAWTEETPDLMIGEGRRVNVLVYRPKVAKGERYYAIFEADGQSTFAATFNPGMITRNERVERSNWSAIASLVGQWARDIKRQADAAAMLEVIAAMRAQGRAGGRVSVDAAKLAEVVKRTQSVPDDAKLSEQIREDLLKLAASIGARLDSQDAKADVRHAELIGQLKTFHAQFSIFAQASESFGAKDLLNHGVSLVMAFLMTAYVNQPVARQAIDQLLTLLLQVKAPETA
jgi:hypothetical protein